MKRFILSSLMMGSMLSMLSCNQNPVEVSNKQVSEESPAIEKIPYWSFSQIL